MKHAKATFRAIFETHRPPEPLPGSLRVWWTLTYPHAAKTLKQAGRSGLVAIPKTTRPDLDNLSKLLLDAATGAGYWVDDSQIVEMTCAKFHGDMPGIAFRMESAEDAPGHIKNKKNSKTGTRR